ncbi:YjfB family protein [Streptohalobacillus salinus]|uniref:YjfB family protein n=1 Tax=Streptohalobacillus salinus TaxID=621096 RepID=UPI001FEA39A7|nr:YjfB family protein [Streptohalobacillus salinus]
MFVIIGGDTVTQTNNRSPAIEEVKEWIVIDIAKMSTLMSQQAVKNQMSLQLMSQTMDMAQQNTEQLSDMLSDIPMSHPDLGNTVDLKA